MIDINIIRTAPEKLDAALAKRGMAPCAAELKALDEQRRAVMTQQQDLQAKRNALSDQIGALKKSGGDASAVMAEVATLKTQLENLTAIEGTLADELNTKLAHLPNMVADDVIAGGKEANAEVRSFGAPRQFDFTPLDHYTLTTRLGLVDFDRGVKIGGSGLWCYTGIGARLEWALLNFFVNEHLKDGYDFIMPPHLLTYDSGFTAGQFPKFEEDVFVLNEKTDSGKMRFLLPTAETALINFFRDEILDEADLPKKMFAYTPCYRREAGGGRADERGTVRGHQFNKVEMFQFTTPEQSAAAHEELVVKAEKLVQQLGLHYKLMKLAAADVSAGMTKTFDVEVFIPSMGYKEVSSVSNAGDYQARRGNMRYRPAGEKNTRFLHTLNASGLATSRLVPAILEQYQQADGSVVVPDVLRPLLNLEVIKA